MLLRHRNTASNTRSAARADKGRMPSSSSQAQRNALYAVIAQHSPQADLPSLVRLLG